MDQNNEAYFYLVFGCLPFSEHMNALRLQGSVVSCGLVCMAIIFKMFVDNSNVTTSMFNIYIHIFGIETFTNVNALNLINFCQMRNELFGLTGGI